MASNSKAGTLDESVAIVAAPWAGSSYYAEAEQWTWLFWSERTPFRRMFDQLDLSYVVELACGHGRHAEQIAALCGQLVLFDIFEDNLAICSERLKVHANVSVVKGNGYDFCPLPSESVTAIFCYDAMVHFSPDIVSSYLADSARVLRPGGKALFHHSNYGSPTTTVHYGQNPHARNHMTQQLFLECATAAGLSIVESEVMDWSDISQLDCLTLVRKGPGSG